MKKLNFVLGQTIFICQILIVSLFFSCTTNTISQEKVKQYQDSIVSLKKDLKEAKDLISVLKYPADQRLDHIKELFNSEKYSDVRKEIKELSIIFPNAKENVECE